MSEPAAESTPLDLAHAAMTAAPDDPSARLQYYARLCDSEIFLLLTDAADATTLEPRVFDLEDGPMVLVFDSAERLAESTDTAADYAALPGRDVIRLLAGHGTSLGVNLGAAESAIVLPPDVLDWIADLLKTRPSEAIGEPTEIAPPVAFPEELLVSLDAKLARAGGLATVAWLAAVRYADDRTGHLLAFVDTATGADASLARAVGEAVAFSGLDTGQLDIVFLAEGDPVLAQLARVALRFDLPPAEPHATAPAPPGSNRDRPPILR